MGKKKILILTQPLHTNYGGLLQAYALQKVLKDMGHDVFTDKRLRSFKKPPLMHRIPRILVKGILGGIFRMKRFRPVCPKYITQQDYEIMSQHTERFIKNNITTTLFSDYAGNVLNEDEINKYDAFVVGSDQVWRKAYSNIRTYFLSFLAGSRAKRISYAASFGKDDVAEYSNEDIAICKEFAPKFDAISVREDSGVQICKEHFNVKAVHHLDPTLLLDKSDYIDLIESEDKELKSEVLMCYVLDRSGDKQAIIDKISKELGLKTLEVMPEEKFNQRGKQDIQKCVSPAVSKWIAGFRDAKFVVTDSFHGTVFSILFNKPFIAIANETRGASRFKSILKIFGLEDRLVYKKSDLTLDLINKPIDFEKVNKIREEKKQEAFEYIKSALA